MVLLRAFVLVIVGAGVAFGYRALWSGPIVWTLEENPPLEPGTTPDEPATTPVEQPGTDQPRGTEPATDAVPATVDEQPPAEDTPQEKPVPGDLTYADLGLEVGVDGAKLIYEMALDGQASIVDARVADDYRQGHIPMAFNLTPSAFRFAIPREVQDMSMDLPVLIYCAGGDCEDSHIVGQKLREIGFKRLHILVDGFPGWKEAGGDVVTGDQP